jgi:hypothetical protein
MHITGQTRDGERSLSAHPRRAASYRGPCTRTSCVREIAVVANASQVMSYGVAKMSWTRTFTLLADAPRRGLGTTKHRQGSARARPARPARAPTSHRSAHARTAHA